MNDPSKIRLKHCFAGCLLFAASILLSATSVAQVEGREWAEVNKPQDVARVLEFLPEGTEAGFVMMPMSDGVRLATTIFLPPGEGPWPVLFAKGFYGRFGMARYAKNAEDGNFAFIVQDARGKRESEGKGTFDPSLFEQHTKDLADALAWIEKQSWSDGRVGVFGGSGNGIAAYNAFLSGSPYATVSKPGNSSGTSNYWMYDNRTRRGLYSWMKNANMSVTSWPRPTVPPADYKDGPERLAQYTPHPDSILIAAGQWYDIVGESAVDAFAAYADKARVFVTIGPNWHGGRTEVKGEKWPKYYNRPVSMPKLSASLLNPDSVPEESLLMYYLMGDPSNPDSLGNEWRTTQTWPVPHTPTSFFLGGDGSITSTIPAPDAKLSFIYDPRDPAPAYGGNGSYSIPVGPMDQSPLAEREDVLRFVSPPLPDALTIVGECRARLFISTDAPDTQFVVKLFDLHPDGTETLIRESAINARFAEGLDGTTPLQAGKVYELNLDLWSTAKVFNPGHRIGVYITSSSLLEGPRPGREIEVYEIHPNTFEPVSSWSEAKTAEQTIHFSSQYPSSILLPVVETF